MLEKTMVTMVHVQKRILLNEALESLSGNCTSKPQCSMCQKGNTYMTQRKSILNHRKMIDVPYYFNDRV